MMPARRNRPAVTARPAMPTVDKPVTEEHNTPGSSVTTNFEEKPADAPRTPETTNEEYRGERLTDAERAELKAHTDELKARTDDEPRTPETTNDVHPSETAQSATVNLARCETRSGKDGDPRRRQCQLNAGHEGSHKYRNTTATPVSSKPIAEVLGKDVDFDAMFDDVPDDEVVQVKEVQRDAFQQKIDARVKESYDAWVAAGKPAEFNSSPRKRWMGKPEAADAVRRMLNRAGTLHNVRVRIAPNKTHESGMTMVYFVASDKLDRKGKPVQTAQVPATPAAENDEPKPDTE